MNIQTETTTNVIITLTEAEARTALVEPEALQHQLRAALAPIGKERAIRSGRYERELVIAPKAKAAEGGRGRYERERKPCHKCGRMMTPQGLGRHTPICQGKPSA